MQGGISLDLCISCGKDSNADALGSVHLLMKLKAEAETIV